MGNVTIMEMKKTTSTQEVNALLHVFQSPKPDGPDDNLADLIKCQSL